jgi:pyruvate formate lyase activating enzyme
MCVERVIEEIMRDEAFYRNSGGGVTLSGGEPSLNLAFAFEILHQCKNHNIHTAIETCGECPWESLDALLPVTDLIMMDIKQLVKDKHREATGRTNERIIANARRLALSNKPLVFRTPVVPTVNDTADDIGQIAAFLQSLRELRKEQANGRGSAGISYELLAFHRLASDKYSGLGLEYRASTLQPPTRQQMHALAEVPRKYGFEVTVR